MIVLKLLPEVVSVPNVEVPLSVHSHGLRYITIGWDDFKTTSRPDQNVK